MGSGLGGVVAPVVTAVDTGLRFHPESGAVTPDFTEAQKEAAPELAANQKDIKHLAYTGHVVQPTVVHYGTGYAYGKRSAGNAYYGGGYGGGYGGYGHHGYGYGKRSADAFYGHHYGHHGYGYGKRSADADAFYGLHHGYGHHGYGHFGYSYGK